jgi:hypothetical protein
MDSVDATRRIDVRRIRFGSIWRVKLRYTTIEIDADNAYRPAVVDSSLPVPKTRPSASSFSV